jgi:hypothetical protein
VSAGDQKACRSWNRGFKDVEGGRIGYKGFRGRFVCCRLKVNDRRIR